MLHGFFLLFMVEVCPTRNSASTQPRVRHDVTDELMSEAHVLTLSNCFDSCSWNILVINSFATYAERMSVTSSVLTNSVYPPQNGMIDVPPLRDFYLAFG
jgi:hypothetical protein